MANNDIFGLLSTNVEDIQPSSYKRRDLMAEMAARVKQDEYTSALKSKQIEAQNKLAFDGELARRTQNWGAYEQESLFNVEKNTGVKLQGDAKIEYLDGLYKEHQNTLKSDKRYTPLREAFVANYLKPSAMAAMMESQAKTDAKAAKKTDSGSGFFGGIGDVALSLGQSVVGLGEIGGRLVGANDFATGAGNVRERLQSNKTDSSQAERKKLQEAVQKAEASGVAKDEIFAYLDMFKAQPLEFLAETIGPTLGIGALARAGGKTALKLTGKEAIASTATKATGAAAGAAFGLGEVKGNQYETTLNEAKARGFDDITAKALAEKASEYSLANAGQQAAGAALGLAGVATGPLDKLIMGTAAKVGTAGIAKRVGMGALIEGGTEALQEGQGKLAGNLAAIDAGVMDASQAYKGVAGSAALGGVIGGTLGGVSGGVSGDAAPQPELDPTVDTPTQPLSALTPQQRADLRTMTEGDAFSAFATATGADLNDPEVNSAVLQEFEAFKAEPTIQDGNVAKQIYTDVTSSFDEKTSPIVALKNALTGADKNTLLDGLTVGEDKDAATISAKIDDALGFIEQVVSGKGDFTNYSESDFTDVLAEKIGYIQEVNQAIANDDALQAKSGIAPRTVAAKNVVAEKQKAEQIAAKEAELKQKLADTEKAKADKEAKTLADKQAAADAKTKQVTEKQTATELKAEAEATKFIRGETQVDANERLRSYAESSGKPIEDVVAKHADSYLKSTGQGGKLKTLEDFKQKTLDVLSGTKPAKITYEEAIRAGLNKDQAGAISGIRKIKESERDYNIRANSAQKIYDTKLAARKGSAVKPTPKPVTQEAPTPQEMTTAQLKQRLQQLKPNSQKEVNNDNTKSVVETAAPVATALPESKQVNANPSITDNAAVTPSVTPTISGGDTVLDANLRANAGSRAVVQDSAKVVQEKAEADLAPISKTSPEILEEQRRLAKVKRKQRMQGMSNALKPLREQSPFLEWLMVNGIAKSEQSEWQDFNPQVPFIGRLFRENGKSIDNLVELAVEDGYLPPNTNDQTGIRELISRQAGGVRVEPLYTEDGATNVMQAEIDRRAQFEEDAAFEELSQTTYTTAELDALEDIPWDMPAGSGVKETTRQAMEAMGFSEQEIQDEIAREQRIAQETSQSSGRTSQTETSQPRKSATAPTGQAEPEALVLQPTTPETNRAQQQQRDAEAQRREQGGDAPLPTRKVTADTPDMFKTQGSVFDQPQYSRTTDTPFGGIEQARTPLGDTKTVTVNGKEYSVFNSEGKPIHPTVEGVRNFVRWFGESKVTDNGKTMVDGGKPLVVYHGTGNKFNVFKPTGSTRGNDVTQEIRSVKANAFFFSDSKESAQNVANVRANTVSDVKPIYIKAEYIQRIEDNSDIGDIKGVNQNVLNVWENFDNPLFVDSFKEDYDGASFEEKINGEWATTYVVFESSQIKSATGNTGNFNPTNPDITQSQTTATTPTGNTPTLIRESFKAYFGKDANEKLKQVFVVDGAKDVPEGAVESEVSDNAQAFYNPKTGDIYLIADKIKQGDEVAVLLHEIGHKRLQQAIGTVGMRNLRKGVDVWKYAPDDSNERIVFEAADARAKKDGNYDAEIITYAIEEAGKLGIEPKALAPQGTVAKWLASVKVAFDKAVAKLFKGDVPKLTTSDLLDIAKGAARLELENAPTNIDSKDADYLAAVERGDMESAQRMVDEAAKEAGYSDTVYHAGTVEDRFDQKYAGTGIVGSRAKSYIFFGSDKNAVDFYSEDGTKRKTKKYAINTDGFADFDGGVPSRNADEAAIKAFENDAEFVGAVTRDVIDGDKAMDVYTIPYNNDGSTANAKLLDPVTYDNNGNIIPLSQRFNTKDEDIRYSRTPILADIDAKIKAAKTVKARLAANVVDIKTPEGKKLLAATGKNFLDIARGFTSKVIALRELANYYESSFRKDGKNLLDVVADFNTKKGGEVINALGRIDREILKGFKQLNTEQKDALGVAMTLATQSQFDPSTLKTPTTPEGVKAKTAYNKLTPDSKSLYKKILVEHRAQWDRYSAEAVKNITDSGADVVSIAKIKDTLEQGKMDVYFAQQRFGSYVVSAVENGNDVFFRRYETRSAAEKDRAALEKAFPSWSVSSVTQYQQQAKPVFNSDTETFILSVMGRMEKQGKSESERKGTEEVMRSIIESSLVKKTEQMLTKRKGILGADTDMMRSTISSMKKMEQLISSTKYNSKLAKALGDAKEHVKSKSRDNGYDSVQAAQVLNAFEESIYYKADESPIQTAASYLNAFGFLSTMAYNISSGLVNTSSIATLLLPQLNAKHGLKANAVVAKAMYEVGANFTKDQDKLTGDLKTVVDYATNAGMLHYGEAKELLDVASGLGTKTSAVVELGGRPMEWGEKMVNITALLASFRLNKQKGLTNEQALEQAKNDRYRANFDNSANNKGYYAKTPIGRVLMMLKGYGFAMTMTLMKDVKTILDRAETKEQKAYARKHIMGVVGAHALLSGLTGMPFIATWAMAAIASLMGDDDDERDGATQLKDAIYEAFGKEAGNSIYNGLLGAGVSGRISLDGLIFRARMDGADNKKFADDYLNQLLGAGIGNVKRGFEQSVQFGKELETLPSDLALKRFAQNMPISAAANLAKGFGLFEDDGIKYGKDGRPLNETPASNTEMLGQLLGIRAKTIAEAQNDKSAAQGAISRQTKRKEYLLQMHSALGLDVLKGNSGEEQLELLNTLIAEHNQKYPNAEITDKLLAKRTKKLEDNYEGEPFGFIKNKDVDMVESETPWVFAR